MMHQSVAQFHSGSRRLARLAGLLALAILGPACYSSSGHTYMAPGAPGGVGSLFADNFVSFPTNWTTPSTATVNVTNPLPYYYLTMTDKTRPGSTSTTTTMSFTTQNLTFAVQVFYSAASTSADILSVVIVDGSNATLAQATLDASTGMMSFQIGGSTVTPAVAIPAGSFQSVQFQVNTGTNTAVWIVGATTTTSHAFGPTTTKLQLGVSYDTAVPPASPTFEFTGVNISNP